MRASQLSDRDYRHRGDDDCRRPAGDRPGRAVRHLGRVRHHPDHRGHGWQMPDRGYHPDPDGRRLGGQQEGPRRTG